VIVAIAALSVVCVLNLLLTVGVIRRLREHTTLLDTMNPQPPQAMRATGAEVDDFAVTAQDGTPVARRLLAGLTLVGFFSTTCEPCHERLPDFVARARRMPGGRPRVLAVVASRADDHAGMVASLADAAAVVVEGPAGELARAFGVRAFPAFGLVDEAGTIVASSTDLGSIPIPVAA